MPIILSFFLGFFLIFSSAVNAEDAPQASSISFGLAMHGKAKYGPEDTHLDYVIPEAPKGGQIKHAAIGTFDTINPYSIKGKAAQGLNLVYDRLMRRVWDEPFTMYPLIAKGYDMPEDRSSITFYLDERARFHDGSPITAADILFSYETLRDFGRPNMRRVYKLVEEARIISPTEITFTFTDEHDEETALIMALMPVLSKSYWAGQEFDSTTLDTPILNGPYRIYNINAGRQIIYERVEDYWAADLMANRGHYNFDRIIYDYYRDENVSFEAFKSGNVDFRRESDGAKWHSAYEQNDRIIKEELSHGRPERVRSFIFNTRRVPFDDVRVRQALNLAFDFEWVNKNLFYNSYKRINSVYPNSMLSAPALPSEQELTILEPFRAELPESIFTQAIAQPSAGNQRQKRQNLRKATSLLDEAGWTITDGKRLKDGQPLKIELLLNAPEEEKIALHFQRSLERLGIELIIRVMDTAAFRGRLNVYDFDMVSYFWQSSLSPGTEQILYWSCEAAEQEARWNFAGICHPAIDKIAADVARASSREELVIHLHALDRTLMHHHLMIPLYYAGFDRIAYHSHIKRPPQTPLYGLVIESWWKAPQK